MIGTYLAYPRDLRAARMIYDGRWEQGHSPVQWSVTRFLAAPLSLMRDAKRDVTFVLMARPEDCFAVAMPYNKEPPDGVAGHRSMYFSLFGGDLKAGQPARARTASTQRASPRPILSSMPRLTGGLGLSGGAGVE